MGGGFEGGGDSAKGAKDSDSRGGNDSTEGGSRSGSFGGSRGDSGGANGNGGGTNGETRDNNGETRDNNGENGGENGEGGGENPCPPDRDPVRDEAISRPPKRDRDNDYYWPIPEINTPTVRINASGGYGTEVRPSGSSRVAETTIGVSGGATVLPNLEIGNFNK